MYNSRNKQQICTTMYVQQQQVCTAVRTRL